MANYFGDGEGMYLDSATGGYPVDDGSNDVPVYASGSFYNNQNSSLLTPSISVDQPTIQTPGLTSWQGIVPSNQQMVSSGDLGLIGANTGASGWGAAAGAVGTAVSIYNNSSTDTGSSVLSGAASGAAAGAYFGPIGMAAGAIIGGIIGFFGSKSKKKAEKKAFQQQEQAAVLPYQQQQANYLQKEGLMQKAMSNYSSGFTPGGYKYSNALLGKPNNSNFGIPKVAPQLPNFNVAPPNVVPGSGDSSLGIAPNSVANNGVNLNPGAITQPASSNNPYYGFNSPAPMGMPTAPAYTGKKSTDSANISQYQQQYQQYIQDQRQQMAANAMNSYQPYFNVAPGYTAGAYANG